MHTRTNCQVEEAGVKLADFQPKHSPQRIPFTETKSCQCNRYRPLKKRHIHLGVKLKLSDEKVGQAMAAGGTGSWYSTRGGFCSERLLLPHKQSPTVSLHGWNISLAKSAIAVHAILLHRGNWDKNAPETKSCASYSWPTVLFTEPSFFRNTSVWCLPSILRHFSWFSNYLFPVFWREMNFTQNSTFTIVHAICFKVGANFCEQRFGPCRLPGFTSTNAI